MNSLAKLLLGAMNLVVQVVSGFISGLLQPAPQRQRKEFSLEVVRPDDLLVATLDFYNLVPVTPSGGPTHLERGGAGDSFIILRLPPQAFGEQAFLETNSPVTSEPAGTPPIASRMAGESQIVFQIALAELPLALSLAEILTTLGRSPQLVRSEIGQPPGVPVVGAIAYFSGARTQFTALEAPYRIVLSPSSVSRWQHVAGLAAAPSGQPTELWHTRLGTPATARAVFSPDFADPAPNPSDLSPFRMSLKAYDRHRIVRVTSDRALVGRRAADVDFLALSALGSWLKVQGHWDTELGLAEWRHLLTMGRDEYVRVVDEGYLFETGHRAVLLTITERKVELIKSGPLEGRPGAYLRQRKIIIVREPTKAYGHRHVPFQSVTVKSLVTPNLEDPIASQVGTHGEQAFWPRVAVGAVVSDFEFHLSGVDWEGRAVEYRKPLLFVARPLHDDGIFIKGLVSSYNGSAAGGPPRQRSDFGGQKLAFAPQLKSGDTTLQAFALTFGALEATGSPSFLPGMTQAEVDLPAVRGLSGGGAPSKIAFEPTFLSGAGNPSDVFARLLAATPLPLPKEKTGGLVAPDLDISGLSRTTGPVGGAIDKMIAGQFRPAEIFGQVTILGGIKLGSIIRDLDFTGLLDDGLKCPTLKTVRKTKLINGANREVIETSYRWNISETGLQETGMFQPLPGSTFFIETTADAPLDGTPPNLKVRGELTKFRVLLLPDPQPHNPSDASLNLVGLNFDGISFETNKDAKVDISILFSGFEFLGPLAFVNKLREVIPMDGFQDPPYLDVVLPPDPRAGIKAGFTQAIPTVGLGIFTLQNISFSAGFYLPLLSDPANLRLAFCTREQPFTLTVSLFGGGGFFGIDIGLAGVTQIEAALEFGAAIALNLGVAEGGVSIMGGVYFQMAGQDITLSAYVRANGSLSVLGIITVSVEFYISLTYSSKGVVPHGGQLWGQASVKVKVKIAFFSKTVTLTVEREFAGSDPTLADSLTPLDWAEYCGAFADYAA